jgi:PAS domain S-box-containing protein
MTGASADTLRRLGEALLRDGPDAVILADRDGVIRVWNAGAERIFGYAEAEAVGRSLDLIIPERLRQRHWEGFAQMMRTGRSRHAADELLSVPATGKSGTALSIQFTVTPIRDDGGNLTGIVAVLRDVTEVHQELKRLRALTGG